MFVDEFDDFEENLSICADSFEEKGSERCKHSNCVRYLTSKSKKRERNIFTASAMKNTPYCPYYKEEE